MKDRIYQELPDEKQEDLKKAKRLAWWTIAFFISVIILVYFVMGNSQAMKTAWVEDILGLVPPVAFLISLPIAGKTPNNNFPYGYLRIIGISFLVSALALFALGGYMLIENTMKLLKAEHPSIGMMTILGFTVWQGWLMILVMIYSAVPAVLLGRKKIPLAKSINDKALFTDARMNRADWMTALAAIVGVLGVGLGWWWADGAAAWIIAADITHDGWQNLRRAVDGLMDRSPQKVEEEKMDPVVNLVFDFLRREEWIDRFGLRLRDESHIIMGEVFIVPRPETADWFDRKLKVGRQIPDLDWRLQDITVSVVDTIPDHVAIRGGSVQPVP